MEDLKNLIDALAISASNGFDEARKDMSIIENRVGGVEVGIFKLGQKIDGLASRTDDLATNRVKNEIYEGLVRKVNTLEKKLGSKNGK